MDKGISPSKSSVKVAKGSFIILVDYICVNLLAVVYAGLVGRLLGPHFYGIVATGLAFYNVFTYVANFGIPSSIVRFISKYIALKKPGMLKPILRISFKYLLLSSLMFSATLIVFAGTIATNIYHDPKLTFAFRVVGAMILPGVFLSGLLSAFQGFQRMEYHLFTESFYAVARVPLALILIIAGYRATGALTGVMVALFLACALGLLLLSRLMPKGMQEEAKGDVSREIISFSIPNWVTSIAGMILLSYGTIWLGYVARMQEVGYYSSALLIASSFSGIAGATITALFPTISELWTIKDRKNFALSVGFSIKFIFAVLMPLVAGTTVFSEFILRLAYGVGFIAGGQVLRILSLAVLPICMNSLNITILAGIGRPDIGAKIYLAATAMAVGTITPLAWHYGIVGAAVGFLLTHAAILCMSTFFVKKLTNLAYPTHAFLKPVISACIMFIPVVLLRLMITSLIEAVFVGVLGLLVYALAFLKLGGVQKSDVNLLRQISSDMGKPSILEKIARFLDAYAEEVNTK